MKPDQQTQTSEPQADPIPPPRWQAWLIGEPHPVWTWLSRLSGWLLAGVFLYAGVIKMLDPAEFAVQIRNYQLAPWWAIHPAAISLPLVEIVAAVLLLLGIWAFEATVVLGGLLVLFMVGIGWAMHLGLDVECGCFGGDSRVGWGLLLQDAALLAAAGISLLARRRGSSRFNKNGNNNE